MKIQLIHQKPEETLVIRPFTQSNEPGNQHMFKAEKGEVWWYSSQELWFGLGKAATKQNIGRIFRSLFFKLRERWPEKLVLDARELTEEWLEPAVNGVLLGGYNLQLYKSEPKKLSDFFSETGTLYVLVNAISDNLQKAMSDAQHTADVQMKMMDLMNQPGNYKTPEKLGAWAVDSAARYGYQTTVLDKTQLEDLGMHALLAVNQGSARPPVMIVSEYKPEQYTKTVALVGKGVTFDTGGISIKPSANMHLMKSDMGGAAAVLGTIELAARLKWPVRIIGVIPSTENCVDGASMKPGDVIGSYAGKTIEVIDTDAEGRLILADGLSYAVKTFQPDVLIDLATLTGSVIQTLGYEAAGLFTPNDELAAELTRAGEETGERLWRLPIWDAYAEEVSSDIADVKNYHGKPLAGAIVAAKFLEVFTGKHTFWAHLDIAGMAFGDAEFAPARAGTAYGIRLLKSYLTSL